jgi:hypothetical protein
MYYLYVCLKGMKTVKEEVELRFVLIIVQLNYVWRKHHSVHFWKMNFKVYSDVAFAIFLSNSLLKMFP